jgi:nicotinamide mononucleotide adenylyltransferase
MNGKQPLDHSKVNPFNTGERRQYMQAVFSHLGLPFKKVWRQQAERTVCKTLHGSDFHNSSIAWFEFEVDRVLWSGIRKSNFPSYFAY